MLETKSDTNCHELVTFASMPRLIAGTTTSVVWKNTKNCKVESLVQVYEKK